MKESEYQYSEKTIHQTGGVLIRIEYYGGALYRECWSKNGILHRGNGLPALVGVDGNESYVENGFDSAYLELDFYTKEQERE